MHYIMSNKKLLHITNFSDNNKTWPESARVRRGPLRRHPDSIQARKCPHACVVCIRAPALLLRCMFTAGGVTGCGAACIARPLTPESSSPACAALPSPVHRG